MEITINITLDKEGFYWAEYSVPNAYDIIKEAGDDPTEAVIELMQNSEVQEIINESL